MHSASNITRIRVRIAALALGLALTAAVVAACGSSNENTTSGGAAASTSTAAKSTSTAAAATGNEASAGVTDYVKNLGGKAGAADASKSPIACNRSATSMFASSSAPLVCAASAPRESARRTLARTQPRHARDPRDAGPATSPPSRRLRLRRHPVHD